MKTGKNVKSQLDGGLNYVHPYWIVPRLKRIIIQQNEILGEHEPYFSLSQLFLVIIRREELENEQNRRISQI